MGSASLSQARSPHTRCLMGVSFSPAGEEASGIEWTSGRCRCTDSEQYNQARVNAEGGSGPGRAPASPWRTEVVCRGQRTGSPLPPSLLSPLPQSPPAATGGTDWAPLGALVCSTSSLPPLPKQPLRTSGRPVHQPSGLSRASGEVSVGASGSASFLLHPSWRTHCPRDFTKCFTSGGSCHKMRSWIGREAGTLPACD